MLKVQVMHEFAIPPRELWALIGDFGDTGKWTGRPPEACVEEGQGIGRMRTLTVADGRRIVDRLEAEGENFYSYSIVTSPLPVLSYKATMRVEPAGEGTSCLIWSGEVEPAGMSDADALAYWEAIYRMGIGLMERTIAAM